MRRISVALLATLLLAGCSRQPSDYAANPGEFVCETSGALTERQVGVAWADYLGDGDVRVYYVDGVDGPAVYRMRDGETCNVERIPQQVEK
jgi:uncharacterized lipoprotein YajG